MFAIFCCQKNTNKKQMPEVKNLKCLCFMFHNNKKTYWRDFLIKIIFKLEHFKLKATKKMSGRWKSTFYLFTCFEVENFSVEFLYRTKRGNESCLEFSKPESSLPSIFSVYFKITYFLLLVKEMLALLFTLCAYIISSLIIWCFLLLFFMFLFKLFFFGCCWVVVVNWKYPP